MAVELLPLAVCPLANCKKDGKADSEDDAQQGSVFDERSAVVVFVKGAGNGNEVHLFSHLLEFRNTKGPAPTIAPMSK